MRTITKEIFKINELSPEAKEYALNKLRETNEHDFLTEYLQEILQDKIKDLPFTNFNLDKIYYSLSYCQGDGLMIECEFEYKNIQWIVKQSGFYYHEKSYNLDYNENGATEKLSQSEFTLIENEVENLYESLCIELRDLGYDYIEYEDSEENLLELCNCNEYEFYEDGTMY